MTRHYIAVSACFVLLIFSIAFGLVGVGRSQASAATLCVNPSSVIDPSLQSSKTFAVSVEVANVSMLSGVEFKLFWNATLLDLVQVSLSSPWNGSSMAYVARNDNATPGVYWFSAALTTNPMNGTSSIASLTFRVENMGSTALQFGDVVLGDEHANPIGYETVDGFFSNGFADVNIASFRVWPTAVYQGEPIYVNATVENVGTYNEQFNVLLYADRTDGGLHVGIANESVALAVGEFKSLQFVWNTTAVPYGSYVVTAQAALKSDSTPVNNMAHGLVGGIYMRLHPITGYSVWMLLAAFAYGIIPVLLLAVVVFGIFKLVLSVSIRFKRFD